MKIQSWMIKSWTSVEWYLPEASDAWPGFQHMSTHIRESDSQTGLRGGETVWMVDGKETPTGMAWEWQEVRPGVVMLTDPNAIVTNLQIIDSERQRVQGLEKVIAVNRLVHQLPWQTAVVNRLADEPAAELQQARPAAVLPQRALASVQLRQDVAKLLRRDGPPALDASHGRARQDAAAHMMANGPYRRASDQKGPSHQHPQRRAA